jgi:hypothetical protein
LEGGFVNFNDGNVLTEGDLVRSSEGLSVKQTQSHHYLHEIATL